MRALRNKPLLIILLFSIVFPVLAQEGIPIIKRYSVENYKAGIENWDAIQDDEGLMYFANSEGVLEFDGVHWRLIQTNSKSKIRSLGKSDKGVIYVGGDSEFGYLSKDANGQKVYKSLIDSCPPQYHSYLNHIWKVVLHEKKSFFLAGGAVIVFDEENNFVKVIEADIYLRSIFLIGEQIVGYNNRKGLLVLDNTKLEFSTFYSNEFILNRSLEFISAHPKGGIRLHIFGEGFYRLHQGKLSVEKKNNFGSLDTDYIFCQGKTNQLLLLGTTTNGLYALSNRLLEGKYHIDKSIGLNDNKIFSIYADHDSNLWISHENGLSYIEINSPVRLINEKLGINGIGHCTNIFDSTLFVGTSHGLFTSKLGKKNHFYDFHVFKQIRQPIYFLEKKGKSLLIGCHHEIFDYDGETLKVLSTSRHNNKIKAFPNKSNYYLVSHDKGFVLLKYDKGFQLLREIKGIYSEINDFEIDNKGNTWVINSKGELLIARLNSTMDSFAVQKRVKEFESVDLKFLSVSSFNSRLVLGTSKGLYEYDWNGTRLRSVDEQEKGKYSANWLYNQNNEELWYEKTYYSNGKLHYLIDILSDTKDHTQAQNLNSVIYGNKAFSFGTFNTSELAIGTSEGFLLYNQKFDKDRIQEAEVYIRKILVTDVTDTTEMKGIWVGHRNQYELPLNQEQTLIELHNSTNYFYSQDNVMYSYKLDGVDSDWSEWTKDNIVRYIVNGDGEFIFHVRATGNYSTASNNTTSYRFIIKNPWYKTFWWYSIELGILIMIMSVSFYLNRKGSTKTSKVSAFILVLIILTVFEILSELTQDWIDAQGLTIFALKIAINIFIAITITPVELWVRKKLIRPSTPIPISETEV